MPLKVLRGLLTSETSKEVHQYIATVRYAFPWMNLYVVEPYYKNENTVPLELVTGGDGAGASGAIYQGYAINDTVLVASTSGVTSDTGISDYIVCTITPEINQKEDGTPDIPETPTKCKPLMDLLHKVYDGIRTSITGLYANAPKVFTQPGDLLAGDVVLQGAQPDHRISVLKHMIRIQCGEGCYVELDSLLDRIRVVTSKTEMIGPLKCNQDVSGIGTLAEYSQTALTPEEGSCYTDDNPTALYRKRDIQGDLTMGWSTAVSLTNIEQHSTTDVYYSHVGYDGFSSCRSASGFEFRKSMDISSPVMKADLSGIEMYLNEVDKFNPQYQADTLESYIRDRSINLGREESHNRSNHDNPRVKANPDVWDTTDNTRSAEWNNALKDIPGLQVLDSEHEYPLPEYIEVEDPHTKLKYRYFKSTAGFRQEIDGSLVLYDGYGSEIRMTRGNIIISSAADTIIRPGRDLHSMAGRHTAFVSQKDITIHSSLSDVYVKAERSLKATAGYDRDGIMVFDMRGDNGMLIRSESQLAIAGPDVSIVGTDISASTGDTLNVSIEGTEHTGMVTIVGKKAVVRGDSDVVVYGADKCTMVGNRAFIDIRDNGVTTAGKLVRVSGTVGFGPLSGAIAVSPGSERTIQLGNCQDNGDYTVTMTTPIKAKAGILTEAITAKYGNFIQCVANNASGDSRMHPIDQVTMPTEYTSTPSFTINSGSVDAVSTSAGSTYFILGNSFSYPSSKSLGISTSKEYIIPGMRWQEMLPQSVATWTETPVHDIRSGSAPTMVYPGKEAWDTLKVSKTGGSSVGVIGGYKINGRAN